MRPTAAEIAATLGLRPHREGGFFLETFRADERIATPRGDRAASTAILFLVTAAAISHLHRLASDELWVFQGGLPLELVAISPEGELHTHLLGDVEAPAGSGGGLDGPPLSGRAKPALSGLSPQALVRAGSWQGARLAGGPHLPASRAWALVTCIVSPGFDYEDFELGERETLLAAFPRYADAVTAFT